MFRFIKKHIVKIIAAIIVLFIASFICFIAVLVTAVTKEYDGYFEGFYYDNYTYNNVDGISIEHCDLSGDVVIPDEIEGKPVLSVGSSGINIKSDRFTPFFYNASEISLVELPDTLKIIESYAFMNCIKLERISVPSSVSRIENQVFENCENLIDIEFHEGLTYVGYRAFAGCTSLREINIPDTVTDIGDEAFSGCTSLNEITMPFVLKKEHSYANNYNYLPFSEFFESRSEYMEVTDGITINLFGREDDLAHYSFDDYGYFEDCMASEINLTGNFKEIGNSTFKGCSNLIKVSLSPSVKEIGSYVFSGCNNLDAVYITDIAAWCAIDFADNSTSNPLCYAENLYLNGRLVTELVIPKGVTSIGDCAFCGYTGLKSIKIPESVTTIGNYAFSSCTNLSRINSETAGRAVLYQGLTSIGDFSFFGLKKITEVTVPDSVNNIGQGAFQGCDSLAKITLPFVGRTRDTTNTTPETSRISWDGGSQYLFGYIFGGGTIKNNSSSAPSSMGGMIYQGESGYSDYYNYYYIPDSLHEVIISDATGISANAFYNCSGMTSITLNKGITVINTYAFYNCTGLTDITIPEGVTSIGGYAFRNCTGLTSITVPTRLTNIGSYAFQNCSALTIYCEASSKASGWQSNWNSDNCPVVWDCKNNSIADDGYLYVIINGIKYSIKDNEASVVVQPASVGGEIAIPSDIVYNGQTYSVTSIGNSAFKDVNLTSITIPETVTSIGNMVFFGCAGLKSITLPTGLEFIGGYAFYSCTGLTSITIPEGVTSIGENAFASCTSLESITLPASLKSIGSYSFGMCTSLISITIPEGVTSIGENAFASCTSLESIMLPKSLGFIGGYAFSYCTNLIDVTMPEGVTNIGYGAFRGCRNLTSIMIPESVTSIGNYAFYGCSNLTIYCVAESKPVWWSEYWNSDNCPVVWGYEE